MPNYNDDTCIANIMLNEATDSNDAKRTVNSVCLTIMGAQQFSMEAILPSCRKLTYQRQDIITQKQKVLCRQK